MCVFHTRMNLNNIIVISIFGVTLTIFFVVIKISNNYVRILEQFRTKYRKNVIIITGATGAVGEQLIKLLWKDYKIICIGRNQSKLNTLQALYCITPVNIDLSVQQSIMNILKRLKIQNSQIALVFSNHGSLLLQQYSTIDPKEQTSYLQTNLLSHLAIISYCQTHSIPLVLTGSSVAYVCPKNYDLYHLSKKALLSIAKSQKIRIVNPPTIRDSKFFDNVPLRRGLMKLGVLPILSVTSRQVALELIKSAVNSKGVRNFGIVTFFASLVSKLI